MPQLSGLPFHIEEKHCGTISVLPVSPRDMLEEVMKKTGIKGSRRAETLTVDEFRLLATELAAGGHTG